MRHRVLATTVVLTVLLAGCGTDEETATPQVPGPLESPAVEGAAPSAVPPVAPLPPAPGTLVDGSFESELPSFEEGADGTFEGTARITNTSNSPLSGTVTYTISSDGELVGTAVGQVDGLVAGETEQIELTSDDPFVEGPYQVEFAADARS